jgi:hypothetical protein
MSNSLSQADFNNIYPLPETKTRLSLIKSEQPHAPENSGAAANSYGWILHPAIDLMMCCGGLVWLLFAFHNFLVLPLHNEKLTALMSLLVIIATHALSETHTSATLFRAYATTETRKRYSLYTKWAALACAALALAGLFIKGFTPVMAKVYMLWVVQHFTAQTYGLCLLYCYKNNYKLGDRDKLVLSGLLNLTAAYAIIRQLTYKEWNGNGFLAQTIPFWGPLPEWICTASMYSVVLAAAAFVAITAIKFAKERQILPLPAAFMLLTGVSIFVVGRDIAGVLWLYVPAFFHGAQYVVVTCAHHLKEKGLPEGTAPSEMWRLLSSPTALKYLGSLLGAAVIIYIGVPRLLQDCGFDYTLTFATIFCAVNLHHFLTDQAIWKLRDPKLRKALACGR